MTNIILKHKFILLIFLLAFFLRVWQLGTVPDGFHIDEVKVGWNAYSILKTGLDDRGNKLALYYNSFGDFRPTGIFYITIPSILLFGKNEFAIRFPSAFLGALTVFPLYLFILEIGKKKSSFTPPPQGSQMFRFAPLSHPWSKVSTTLADKTALFASLLLAISPWHIATSRATSEVIISVFFALWGLCFLVKGINSLPLRSPSGHLRGVLPYLASFVLLATSYFFYHSIRILAPLFVGGIIFYYWKEIFYIDSRLRGNDRVKLDKWALLVFVGLVALTGLLSLNKEARGRFSQVSIFNDLTVQYELSKMPFEEGNNKVFIARLFHNKITVYSRRFLNEYGKYFSADFLIGYTGLPKRYMTVGVGVMTYIELGLLILGLISIAQKKFSILPLLLLLLSVIPAALTTEDAPNLHRSLFMVIWICIIGGYSIQFISEYKTYSLLINLCVFLALAGNFIFFLHMYFVHNRVHEPRDRNQGAKELIAYLNQVQGKYDKILLTNIPDDPYPWFAFLTDQEPGIFNPKALNRDNGSWYFDNIEFTKLRCPSRDAFVKPAVKRLLVVDAEGCATESNLKNRTDVKLINVIKRPDESEVYNIWSRIEE